VDGAGTRAGRPRGTDAAGLLEVARQVFLEAGFAGATMSEVATRARVSKSSLYRDYPSKAALFAAVVADWVARGRDAMRPHVDTLLRAEELEPALREFARVLQGAVLSEPVMRMRQLVIAEAERFPEVARDYLADSWDRNIAVLADAFADLARRRAMAKADPIIAARQFTWLVLGDPLNARSLRGDDGQDATAVAALADEAVATFAARYLPRAELAPHPPSVGH
jgi:TetR/AcrR family transcriptional repressor of mexJK operon